MPTDRGTHEVIFTRYVLEEDMGTPGSIALVRLLEGEVLRGDIRFLPVDDTATIPSIDEDGALHLFYREPYRATVLSLLSWKRPKCAYWKDNLDTFEAGLHSAWMRDPSPPASTPADRLCDPGLPCPEGFDFQGQVTHVKLQSPSRPDQPVFMEVPSIGSTGGDGAHLTIYHLEGARICPPHLRRVNETPVMTIHLPVHLFPTVLSLVDAPGRQLLVRYVTLRNGTRQAVVTGDGPADWRIEAEGTGDRCRVTLRPKDP